MASIEDIKAGLHDAADHGGTVIAQASAAKHAADEMIGKLQAVAQGTSHGKLQEAIAQVNEAKEDIDEAIAAINAAVEAARAYVMVLG